VPRDPILERRGRDYSSQPYCPKGLFSPSFGFAWDVAGNGKTVIRGGFYKAFEMMIFNNTMFGEFSMLPNGLGPVSYELGYVAGPEGTPINVDGNHPEGDYTDLIGQPIKNVIGTLGQIEAAVNAAYSGYQFDPNKGESSFVSPQGVTSGGTIPGRTYRPPLLSATQHRRAARDQAGNRRERGLHLQSRSGIADLGERHGGEA
jgi:hypothetical protein